MEPATPASAVGEGVAFPYRPLKSRRDEAAGPDGSFAPAWEDLFESCARHGGGVFREWRGRAARISRERGLAYRPLPEDEAGWRLDPIPWIFSAAQWESLEEGLSQRVRLYAAILADLYGGRTLLDRGLVPAPVVLGHRGFLRALHDLPPGEGTIGLGISAFDLAWDGAGTPFVLNDRFDCPFGLGLALENRTVVNKVLPNLFRRCGVKRIGHFFTDWFDWLGSLAPSASGQPRVVVLDSEAGRGFEIGFLANYCGVTRVTPQDLTVRDGRVWIRTLGGLERVDVIWKTTSGRDFDLLEAKHEASEGVPGLFEAMRSGGVAVASHPGAEVLQSPGFYPFLDRLCRELLGEDLLIPPVATWWCGEAGARARVLDKLPHMVVKTVGHHRGFRTRYGRRLTQEELGELRDLILSDPGQFVGQEELEISTVPVSTDEGLEPRGAVLRAFAFLGAEDRPQVMPGGLGRVGRRDGAVVSTRDAGESKDIWVRSPAPEAPVSIALEVQRSRVISPEVVPSRTGENLYWAGRYAERTDAITRFAARILEGRASGFAFDPSLEAAHEALLLDLLFGACGHPELLTPDLAPDARLDLILSDPGCPVSVGSTLEKFHRACLAAREKWSPISMLAIESACEGWNEGVRGGGSHYRYQTELEVLVLNLAAFHGLNLDSMTRDEGWALLDAGRRVERITMLGGVLTRVLAQRLDEPMALLVNESVLFISDSLRTYQSKFLTVPAMPRILDLLVAEEDYPRSLRHLLERLEAVLRKLPVPARRSHPVELVVPARAELEEFLARRGTGDAVGAGEPAALAFLNSCLVQVARLHEELTRSYFSHAGDPGGLS